jgi:cyclopropane fatty-acyl-phospholipid synthase-like methyltransferase
MRDSNVWLGHAARLAPGQRVLDAGCGVCGPSIDIARAIRGLRVVGVTVSRLQATTATTLIRRAGLSDCIHVVEADYHALPFGDCAFDTAFCFESVGYAMSLTQLFKSIHRVLRPGGLLYIKDVFRREHLCSDQEHLELAEFDDTFAQRTPTLDECVDAATLVGFTSVKIRDLSDIVSTAHARRAMFDATDRAVLSSFGSRHYRRQSCLPVYFAELTALRPRGATAVPRTRNTEERI